MEMFELVQRYLGRRVEVMVHSYTRISGEVASVFEDCVRLTDTTTYDELDSKSWQTTGEPETIVSLRSISAITCLDDKLRDEPPPGIPESPPTEENSKPVTVVKYESPVIRDRIELFLGAGLVRLVSPRREGDLLEQIPNTRKSIAKQLGFEIPQVRVRDSLSLSLNSYVVKIHGIERGRGELQPDMHMAVSVTDTAQMPFADESFKEPAFGNDAWWIDEEKCDQATDAGCAVVSPATALVTHLRHICVRHAGDLLSLQDLMAILAPLPESQSAVAAVASESTSQFMLLHRTLTSLLSEYISIARLPVILESFIRNTALLKTEGQCENTLFESIYSKIRVDIRETICATLTHQDGHLQAAFLSDEELSLMTQNCHLTELAAVRKKQHDLVQRIATAGISTVLVEDAQRQTIADIICPLAPTIHVISRREIPPRVTLQIVDLPGSHPYNAGTPQQPR